MKLGWKSEVDLRGIREGIGGKYDQNVYIYEKSQIIQPLRK